MFLSYKEQEAEYHTYIENYLDQKCLQYAQEPQRDLFAAMRYSLLAGGKRLRPILVLDFCRMCGGDWHQAVPFAAAIEMVHTYSLIHDDLPCMDNDDYRRGKPTNHKVYGEAMAFLAGDALLTEAFLLLATSSFMDSMKVAAVKVLASCAGCCGMVGGQVLDIQSESRQCTAQEVLDIQTRKTGALISAACQLGVLAAGGSREQLSGAISFAENVGLAFQIRDDMLDVIGNEKELGKAVGVDATKNTFVQLYGLQTCDAMVREHTNKALNALTCFKDPYFAQALASSLIDRTV